jgi:hypothetical protein
MGNLERYHSPQSVSMEVNRSKPQQSRHNSGLRLTFSCMDAKEIVMDTAVVTDVCRDGIGASSERSLTPGMNLALFIECPDSEDCLCVPDARIAWVSGNSFGLSIHTMKMEDQDRLHRMFLSTDQQPQGVS